MLKETVSHPWVFWVLSKSKLFNTCHCQVTFVGIPSALMFCTKNIQKMGKQQSTWEGCEQVQCSKKKGMG